MLGRYNTLGQSSETGTEVPVVEEVKPSLWFPITLWLGGVFVLWILGRRGK